MIKIFLILFTHISFLFSSSKCYIKIPVKYYPIKIFNETNPSNTIHNIINQRLYATLELGTPKQSIQIPIEFETSDFYITNNDELKNDNKHNFLKIKKFDEKSSNSITYKEVDDNIFYGVNFLLAETAKDFFYFGNQKIEIEFYLASHLDEKLPGELGLQLTPSSDLNTAFDSIEKSFLKKMKNSKIINNYVWSILYKNTDNNQECDGYLYIGDYLHEIDQKEIINNKKYEYDELTSKNADIHQNAVKNDIYMDKLFIYKNNNPLDIIKKVEIKEQSLHVKLEHNYGGIKGSEIIRPYLEENIFTKENGCTKDIYKQYNTFQFYYCKNNPNMIQKIKNNFPIIQFNSLDFNYNFTIKADDLFIEMGEYVYCLMVFDDYNKYEWKLGRPFLKKYTFMTDQDGKKIYFYSVIDEVTYRGFTINALIIVIIILIIIFLIVGFLLGRKIYRSRVKKYANILEDDFDYTPPELKFKKDSNIEMSNKLYN